MKTKIQNVWFYADGAVRWREQPYTKTADVGDPVSFQSKDSGHRVLSLWFDGKTHKLQYARVVWLLVYGDWPVDEIDHIDRDPRNNDIDNLRLADRSQNNWNKSLSSAGGVHKHGPSWRVELTVRGKRHRVNRFLSRDAAVEFRDLLASMLHGGYHPITS
jgi:hypothetical protein